MVRYGVNIFVLIDADDTSHLRDILFKLVNVKLPDSISGNIRHIEYDSKVTIHDEEGNTVDLITI